MAKRYDDDGQSSSKYIWLRLLLLAAVIGGEGAPPTNENIIMRRASEASLFLLGFPRKKKPLHNGSYEHRVPKIKNQLLFCTRLSLIHI